MTYAELVVQITTYLQNTETSFVAQIPMFVKLAEERIYHDTQLPVSRQSSTALLSPGVRYLGQPTDFLSSYELSVISPTGSYTPVIFTDVSFIREAYPDPTVTGTPLHYALWDQNTFVFGPTPDVNYQAELHYFRLPPTIVTAGTTWIGDNAPGALLYGSLIEGYVYNKGEVDMFQVYDRRYKEAIGLLKLLSAGKERGDTFRDGQHKIPVEM